MIKSTISLAFFRSRAAISSISLSGLSRIDTLNFFSDGWVENIVESAGSQNIEVALPVGETRKHDDRHSVQRPRGLPKNIAKSAIWQFFRTEDYGDGVVVQHGFRLSDR